jgi:hypothetical protein
MMQQPLVPQNLPNEIAQAATAFQLGPLSGTYKPRISSPMAVMAIAFGIVVADIIVFALIFILTGYVFSILIVVPIAAIVYGVYGLMHYKLRVYTFAGGLIYANGDKIDTARWDQVAAVWQEQRRRRYGYSYFGIIGALFSGSNMKESYTVQRHDGISISIDSTSVGNIQQLGQVIQFEVTRLQAPQALASYNAGQAIPFGPFTISQQGITKNSGTPLPWNQLEGVTLKRGNISIKQTGKMLNWGLAPVGKIPNLGVFNAVVDYAQQNARMIQNPMR